MSEKNAATAEHWNYVAGNGRAAGSSVEICTHGDGRKMFTDISAIRHAAGQWWYLEYARRNRKTCPSCLY
jgi:hypothetical protein